MNHRIFLLSTLALSLGIFSVARADEGSPPTQILIDLQDDTDDADEAAIEKLLGGIDIKLNSIHAADERFFIADVDPSQIDELIDAVDDDPRVESAEQNHIYWMSGIPNDPMWSEQWSMKMIDTPAAWEHAEGNGVVVAVIDTGVAYEDYKKFKRVEDLAGTGFAPGYNFVKDNKHPNDDHGHGTHVAGTIAQTTNNKIGVAGVAPKAKIMPLKVLTKQGWGTAADIADAIRFAADEGAHVINMSLGGGPRSFIMQSAVKYARKKGVFIASAAGNTGRGRVEYPAAYKGAFAVSSVGPDKKLAGYSSWGKELALAAPGGDKQRGGEKGGILQNTITPKQVGTTNIYLSFQGTSMATPHVAGAAALVRSTGVTNTDKIEQILKESAEDAGPAGWDERYGAGILNVGKAVKTAAETKSGGMQFGAGLILLTAFFFRTRKQIPLASIGLARLLFGTLIGSSGLWFLSYFGLAAGSVPGAAILTSGMPAWDLAILGHDWHFTSIWASVLPMLGLTTLLLGVRQARGFLIGLSIGWSAYLAVAAICMSADVQLVPGMAGLLDRIWLLLNAGALSLLALVIAKVEAKRRTA